MEITIRYTLTFPNGNTWENCKQSFNLTDLHSLVDMHTLLHDEKHSGFEVMNKYSEQKEFESIEKIVVDR